MPELKRTATVNVYSGIPGVIKKIDNGRRPGIVGTGLNYNSERSVGTGDVGIAAAGRRPEMTNYGSAATGVRPGIAGNNPNDDNSRQRAYAPKLPDVYVTVTGVCPGITVRNPVEVRLAAITRTLTVEALDRRTPKTPIWVRQMRTLR